MLVSGVIDVAFLRRVIISRKLKFNGGLVSCIGI